MRRLITGAAGFIGRALAAQLAADDRHQVAILVRDHYRSQPLPQVLIDQKDRLLVVFADLRDYQNTARAVRAVRPDLVYHLAAGGISDPYLDVNAAIEQNLYSTLNLLRAAFEQEMDSHPRQLVAVRTPGELSAMNPYAASKAAAWQFCAMYARTRGWPISGVMPFQTYGPGQHDRHLVSGAMAAALAGEDFPMTEGSQEKDWIYIDDVVDGLIAVGEAELPPGTNVELGTGTLNSVADIVSRVYDVTGKGGGPLFGALPSRAGEVQAHAADVETARALIGWQASISLDEGLARYCNHMQDQAA